MMCDSVIEAPYGSWQSALTADMIVQASVGFQELLCDKKGLYWTESRPSEQGRVALIYRPFNGTPVDLAPSMSVRTRVHEYGGGSFKVFDEKVYAVHAKDQQLYFIQVGQEPKQLTFDPTRRYADFDIAPDGQALVCVSEKHCSDGSVLNELFWIPLNSSDKPHAVVSSHDFYSSPRFSPDGNSLVWIAWNHPHMPWDHTELFVGAIAKDGVIQSQKCIGGQEEESICLPQWSPDGNLYFISDRSGFWNLYRLEEGRTAPLCPMDVDFSLPPWTLGKSSYAFIQHESEWKIFATFCDKGIDRAALLDLSTGVLTSLALPFNVIKHLCVQGSKMFFFAASAATPTALVEFDIESEKVRTIKESCSILIDPALISPPELIVFPSREHQDTYAFYYPPRNPRFRAPQAEKPPLIVKAHGGPTAHATAGLNLETQYWTSRGFAVVDVNYGGSSGFGRSYRKRLSGAWGIRDVEDCIDAALYLAHQGLCDKQRLVIKGGSAGGYTVLCALTFHRVFACGVSYYGVSDLEALVKDTHKFEAKYLDGLIAPFPEGKAVYEQRSPIHHVDKLDSPLLLLQGKQDPVVPPSQAEMIFDALKRKGAPVSLLLFDKEQHGFRIAANIKRAIEAELYFYSKILHFPLFEPIEPISIETSKTR
ncbi:MAG: S9 family peptidase [Anaerolineae bacterium]